MIPRLADVTEGTVFVDGMDVRKLLRHELDQAIGMVPQKAFLFSGTLEDNLDYRTDQELRRALKPVTQNAAVIIVAQRISTIKDADQILVMNQGRIEAVGTHEELMQSSRTYQEIVASQPTDKEVAS